MEEKNENLNKKVAAWWDDNPFVYSFEKKEVAPNVDFFREVDRKFIKWTPWGQRDMRPLSGMIDYNKLRDKKVLDIAVGTGWSTEQFARHGATTTAIDISPKAIDLTKKRFKTFDLPEPEALVADAQNMPFADGTFDFVLAWGCLMHMPDTEKAIREIHRVLKPGGRMAAMMYNKNSLHWWYYIWLSKGILRGKLLSMSAQQLANRYTDGVYQGGNQLTKFYSRKDIKKMFSMFNSCKVRVYDTTTPIDHLPHRRVPMGSILPIRFKNYLTKKLGQSLWIEVQK
ncbi:MAG: class I SAM-dependent methyltransferase [bacterium]|nr:class I SAM-dependent methyltransferase [bacterium]